MKPKLNKLITLLLLLGTFAFLMEAEQRVSAVAAEELSKWASLLPVKTEQRQVGSMNPFAQKTSVFDTLTRSFPNPEKEN